MDIESLQMDYSLIFYLESAFQTYSAGGEKVLLLF